MSGEHVVINPLLAAIKKEEERKKAKESERMRRRKLRAERRTRARAGSGSNHHRGSKRNSSQLPLPIPSYEELAKTSVARTNSDDTLLKQKLGSATNAGRPTSQLAQPASNRGKASQPRNGENGPLAGPRTHKHSKDTKDGGDRQMERKGECSDNSCSSYDEREEEDVEQEAEQGKLLDSGERWSHLREETGFYYLDSAALDVLEKWLQDLRLPTDEYLKLFLSQGFDNLQTIALLTEEDIAQMGITKIGHRKKILFWAQNNRPPRYEELMAQPDLADDDDEDVVAIANFTSWIDYNGSSNSSTAVSPKGATASPRPNSPASPSAAVPISPTSAMLSSPTHSSTNVNISAATAAKPKPRPILKDK